VIGFFHKQGFALKTPQPWPDEQDEQLREAFLQKLEQLFNRPDVDKLLTNVSYQLILYGFE
jgi:hypothetical protein